MMRLRPLALALLIALLPSSAGAAWLDRSHEIFFPEQFKQKISVQQKFSVFWWNFVVISPIAEGLVPDWGAVHRVCDTLKKEVPELLRSAECDQTLKDFKPVVQEWARDIVLRQPMPPRTEIERSFGSAFAQASLPMGESGLIDLLREDPLGTWQQLKQFAERKIEINLPRVNGFFFDEATGRVVIPFQAAFQPSDTVKLRVVREAVRGSCEELPACGKLAFVGPHSASLQNEEQISTDTSEVSWVGTIITLLFAVLLLFAGRWRFFLLFPPVLVCVGAASVLTALVFGSIHGLTLAFGTGIIGLAMDYGIHASLNTKSKLIWRTNFMGLITTLAGLVVLMMSSIPLLRQMMFFSLAGLLIAYAGYYVLIVNWPKFFAVKPFRLTVPKSHPIKTGLVGTLLLACVVGAVVLRPNLDMSQFDFRDSATKEATMWLFKTLKLRSPLFRVHPAGTALDESHQEKRWADNNGIVVENLAAYLPVESEQERNVSTWRRTKCKEWVSSFNESQRKFFQPFFEGVCETRSAATSLSRKYFEHLLGNGQTISLFIPKTLADEQLIHAQYPDASSVREIVSSFPTVLQDELKWMAPLSLFICIVFLLIYYRNISLTLIAVMPFFTGMGMVALAIWVVGYQFSFVSLMAAVIVFGFSLDYGIFATEVCRSSEKKADGVWTAVACSALTSLAGFAPLLFCKHPVLNHLGQTMFFGTLGTYIGAIWGVPAYGLIFKVAKR